VAPTPRIGIASAPLVHDDRRIETANRSFVDAVCRSGGLPLVLPVLPPEHADAAIDGLDGLLLPGGGDIDPARYGEQAVPEVYEVDPARDTWDLALVEAALARQLPVLGVCRGHQVLNVALGGRLIQHVPHLTAVNHQEMERFGELIHRVRVQPGSLVASVLGRTEVGVNTLHHQAVAEPGHGLRVVAWSEDDGLVEAVEHQDRRIIGVQWHPELLTFRPEHLALFEWLVREAEVRRRLPHHPAVGPADGRIVA
jgi:putative glutamine amidotransferase